MTNLKAIFRVGPRWDELIRWAKSDRIRQHIL